MDRLSRFRRHRKDSATSTSSKTSDNHPAASRTPSPSSRPTLAPPPQISREKHSRSPFRGLHLRSSAKRARESPQSTSPPTPALPNQGDAPKKPVGSPSVETVAHPDGDTLSSDGKPKMPHFLMLPQQAIEAKFQDIMWLERNRHVQSLSNPSPDFRWARVTGTHLRVLDRYMNIQPYNNNRVKLNVPSGHVDYINASPITVTPSSRTVHLRPPDRYIAMQGPTQVSTDHVWRMVVEQMTSPAVIVMLTETHEAQIEKCFPYFPRRLGETLEVNEEDEFGDGFRASVTCEAMEETPAGDAIELRKLVVRIYKKRIREKNHPDDPTEGTDEHEEDITMTSPVRTRIPHEAMIESRKAFDGPDGMQEADTDDEPLEVEEERIVYHFLYKKWPDFGVPAMEDLDSFFQLMRLSREKSSGPENPRIVHCSAGVGRTGTFIALEHLMRELEAGALENFDEEKRPKTPSTTHTSTSAASASDAVTSSSADGHTFGARPPDDEHDSIRTGSADGDEPEDLIFDTVNQLREQRRTMVQADAQYVFLYQVLRKLWQDKYGVFTEVGEPAAKRQEVDPFVEDRSAGAAAQQPAGRGSSAQSTVASGRDAGQFGYIYMASHA